MSSRKLKTINIVILSIVYLMASCLGNMSFAITSDTGYANVPNGAYYFENQGNGAYASDLDYYSVVLGSYSGGSQQRWELVHASNGYYYIINSYSGKYLTSPANSMEGSLIEQATLNSSIADRQLWSFTQVYLEEEYTFRIQSKYHEGTDIYLASSDHIGLYGYNLIQSEYFNYNIEWTLYPVKTAYLLGIDYNEAGHDHTSALLSAHGFFASSGYVSNFIIEESLTTTTVKNYLRNCNVFMLRSHGGSDNIGTYMRLDEYGTQTIHSWDIYNYNGNNGIDMSKCDVAAFVGCYTANHATQSLPQSAVNAGADVAIGFETSIGCGDAQAWTRVFANYYSFGYSADYSADLARDSVGRNSSVSSMRVITSNG